MKDYIKDVSLPPIFVLYIFSCSLKVHVPSISRWTICHLVSFVVCSRGTAYAHYHFFFLWSLFVFFPFWSRFVPFSRRALTLLYLFTWIPPLLWRELMRVPDCFLHHFCHFLYRLLFSFFVYFNQFRFTYQFTVALVLPLHTVNLRVLGFVPQLFQLFLVWNHFKFKGCFSQCLRKFTLSSRKSSHFLSVDFNCPVN